MGRLTAYGASVVFLICYVYILWFFPKLKSELDSYSRNRGMYAKGLMKELSPTDAKISNMPPYGTRQTPKKSLPPPWLSKKARTSWRNDNLQEQTGISSLIQLLHNVIEVPAKMVPDWFARLYWKVWKMNNSCLDELIKMTMKIVRKMYSISNCTDC